MAIRGVINGSRIQNLWLSFEWERTSVDNKNNTSVITWSLTLNSLTSLVFNADKSFNLKINDNNYDGTFVTNINWGASGGKTVIKSGTTPISHEADGAKIFNVNALFNIAITMSGTYVASLSLKGTQILDTIPRATIPTITPLENVETGDTIKITLNRASASFTHDLSYAWGKATGVIGEDIATSKSWTIPRDFANHVPNGLSSICIITCKTYEGTKLIGTETVSLTINVNATDIPVIETVDITEAIVSINEKFGDFIQNQSKLNVNIVAKGVYNSTIKKYETKILNTTYDKPTFASELLINSGMVNIEVKVTDSRNRTATVTKTVNVLPYSPPRIELFNCTRANSSGVEDDEGAYLKADIRFNIEPLKNLNDKTYTIKYRIDDMQSWTTAKTGNEYTLDSSYLSETEILNTDNPYIVLLTVSDYFHDITYPVDVATGFTLIDHHESGRGMAIGKVAEYADLFDVNLATRFRKKVTFDVFPLEDTGWLDLTLKTGWSYQYSTDTPKYRKVGNVVYLKGLIDATASAQTTIAELPAGFRPVGQYNRFTCALNQKDFVNIQVGRNGLITDYTKNTSTARNLISLSGISFLID